MAAWGRRRARGKNSKGQSEKSDERARQAEWGD